MSQAILVPSGFDSAPSLRETAAVRVTAAAGVPPDADALAVPVGTAGDVAADLGLDRAALGAAGFAGKVGQTLLVPGGAGPVRVAVGIGDAPDAAGLRDAAAAFALATPWSARPALLATGADGPDPATAAQVLVEGILLARYAFGPFKSASARTAITAITLVTAEDTTATWAAGAERGRTLAGATALTRDLANCPPAHLTATRMAELAVEIAGKHGLNVEVHDRDSLVRLGCGGLLAVNGGSAEPPRIIKLTYEPPGEPTGRLALVGKGIMYDSGGISLKPADGIHAMMKNDMSGAASVLAAMSVLEELGCPAAVTGYLMCTDNMPSGTALKMGDVLTVRGGTTVEVKNTDAEGRLVMSDALVLAAEERPDAIVDIATLTGACMRALGTSVAGVMGNDQALVERLIAAGARTDEPLWQLPLEQRYRADIDSPIADLNNLGDLNGGAIMAALFLAEFVDGVAWAHVDIAGTADVAKPGGWRPAGCSGFGTRLLAELALTFDVGTYR
ncbi:leucyl aminopeptidase [Pseudonocardia sp.]|uniref:leucyl aminopeptidase n=1 Tax=Pseudonocardia sp. TaxID=60912 RepID=UPI002626E7B9|nr:leucyl aminopeptidase [Pseudonocardia sp.]